MQWFPKAESEITTTCVIYPPFNEFGSGIRQTDEEFEQRLKLNKLYNYASNKWGYHARAASTLCQGIIEFLGKRAQVEASIQALFVKRDPPDLGYSQRFPRQMTELHLVAYFGAILSSSCYCSRRAPTPRPLILTERRHYPGPLRTGILKSSSYFLQRTLVWLLQIATDGYSYTRPLRTVTSTSSSFRSEGSRYRV